jgi:hypothetical protein
MNLLANLRFAGLLLSMAALLTACAGDVGVKTPLGTIVWDQYRQERRASREEASARYNYCPTDGCVIRLESVQVSPSPARPGENLTFNTSYTLLTADKTAIPLSISREVFFKGQSLGKLQSIDLRNYNGTWTQQVGYRLPAQAARGDYTLVTRISTAYGMDQKSTDFTVE